jgi:hypothetical protein
MIDEQNIAQKSFPVSFKDFLLLLSRMDRKELDEYTTKNNIKAGHNISVMMLIKIIAKDLLMHLPSDANLENLHTPQSLKESYTVICDTLRNELDTLIKNTLEDWLNTKKTRELELENLDLLGNFKSWYEDQTRGPSVPLPEGVMNPSPEPDGNIQDEPDETMMRRAADSLMPESDDDDECVEEPNDALKKEADRYEDLTKWSNKIYGVSGGVVEVRCGRELEEKSDIHDTQEMLGGSNPQPSQDQVESIKELLTPPIITPVAKQQSSTENATVRWNDVEPWFVAIATLEQRITLCEQRLSTHQEYLCKHERNIGQP